MSTYTHELMTSSHAHGLVGQLLRMVRTWRQRQHDRSEMAVWTERDMRDAGVSPGDVLYEAAKPFWMA